MNAKDLSAIYPVLRFIEDLPSLFTWSSRSLHCYRMRVVKIVKTLRVPGNVVVATGDFNQCRGRISALNFIAVTYR